MSDLTAGFLGAAAGVLVALFGNVVVLPYVLRQQDRRLAASYRAPITGWDKHKLASWTKLVYRLQMPIVFGLVGAISAVHMFGSGE
jgi:hypothetical protein